LAMNWTPLLAPYSKTIWSVIMSTMALAVVYVKVYRIFVYFALLWNSQLTLAQGIHFAENSLFIQISRYLWAFNITPKPGAPPLDMADTKGNWQPYSALHQLSLIYWWPFFIHIELLTRKPNPFKVDIVPRSDAIRQVIQQAAKEANTDIPDVDSIEMTE
jgi:hypothetical protein